jgi:imidazolonepropionase
MTTAARATVIRGISQLVTNDPSAGPGLLGMVRDAAVVLSDGVISWIGPSGDAPAADDEVDVGGRAVLPGWVDSHTHLVFAGDRSAEFTARMAGERYRTGGIAATVAATRAADDDTLLALVRQRLARMRAGGTTCVETKTGYGLTIDEELRCATIAATAGVDEITFLGAHVVPEEFDKDRDGYVDLVCGAMLDAVLPQVRWIDVFCETDAFDDAESRRVRSPGRRPWQRRRVP